MGSLTCGAETTRPSSTIANWSCGGVSDERVCVLVKNLSAPSPVNSRFTCQATLPWGIPAVAAEMSVPTMSAGPSRKRLVSSRSQVISVSSAGVTSAWSIVEQSNCWSCCSCSGVTGTGTPGCVTGEGAGVATGVAWAAWGVAARDALRLVRSPASSRAAPVASGVACGVASGCSVGAGPGVTGAVPGTMARTGRNCSSAVCPTRATSSSWPTPGTCTMIDELPWVVTSASAMPLPLTRCSMMARASFRDSSVGG